MKSVFVDNYFNNNPNFSKKPDLDQSSQIQRTHFKKFSQFGKSSLGVDQKNNIALIKWEGKVDIAIAKKLIFSGINNPEFISCSYMLLDQSDLIDFSTESRIWLKFFLTEKAKKFKNNFTKLATIKPKTTSGLLFSNFAKDILTTSMPELSMQGFDRQDMAISWLLSI